ncbi:MAG: hypothetical protein PWP23_1603 [Candidatus Sumerlaeota bacterium]|nr:hypothetical protein [Candidatus Sumerlaeota bacterium]
MKKTRSLILLSLAPDGLRGVHAQSTATGWSIQARAKKRWDLATADLSPHQEAIADAARTLAQDAGHASACVLLHPAWTTCARTEVPNASIAETREFLALWAERHWPVTDYGAMRTAFVLSSAGDAKSEATVAAVRESTLEPVLAAIEAARLPLSAVIPQGEALRALANATLGEEAGTVFDIGTSGTAIARLCENRLIDFAWLPAEEGGSELLSCVAAEAAPAGRLLLCGEGAAGAREAIAAFATADANGWSAKGAPKLAAADGKEEQLPDVLRGALPVCQNPPANVLNFVSTPGRDNPWTRLVRHPRLIAYTTAAALVLLLALFVSAKLSAALENGARLDLESIAVDLDATEANLSILADLDSSRRDIAGILLDLGDVKPGAVMLTEFDLDARGNLKLAGIAPSYSVAEQFVVKLNESRRFRQFVTQTTSPDKNKVNFSVAGKVRGE